MKRRGVRGDPNGWEREGGKDPSYCDLFWHQPSLVYISLSPCVRFLHTVNHADKVGCSCDAENASPPPPSFCQIKTDMAAQGKVRYKLTETWATNHKWQVLRRVVIFVVIVRYLREGEEDWTQGWGERGRGKRRQQEKKRKTVSVKKTEAGKESGNRIFIMLVCWACSPGPHWTNMHATNCTVHGAQGQDYLTCYSILQGCGSDITNMSHAH